MYVNLSQETGGLIYFGDKEKVGNVFDTIDQQIHGDFIAIVRAKLNVDGSG